MKLPLLFPMHKLKKINNKSKRSSVVPLEPVVINPVCQLILTRNYCTPSGLLSTFIALVYLLGLFQNNVFILSRERTVVFSQAPGRCLRYV